MQVMRDHMAPTHAADAAGQETLTQYLARVGKLPVLQGLALAAQLLAALQAAHRGGRVHGAIQPDQLLLSRTGQLSVCGLDLEAEPERVAPLPAQTQAYLSPEQRRKRPPDHRSDLYSAALITHQLLTGNLPPRGGVLACGLPQPLHTVLQRALAEQPEARFQDAAGLCMALQAAVGPPVWDRSLTAPASVPTVRLQSVPDPEPVTAPSADPAPATAAAPLVPLRPAALARPSHRLRRWAPALAAGCAAVVLLIAALMSRTAPPAAPVIVDAVDVGMQAVQQSPTPATPAVPALLAQAPAVQPPAAPAQATRNPSPASTARHVTLEPSRSEPVRDVTVQATPAPPLQLHPQPRPQPRVQSRPEPRVQSRQQPRPQPSARLAAAQHRRPALSCNQSLLIVRDLCQAIECSRAELHQHPVCVRIQAQRRAIDAQRQWLGGN